jgi:hypothetical protein
MVQRELAMRILVGAILAFMGLLMVSGLVLLFMGQAWGMVLEMFAALVGWAGLRWARQLAEKQRGSEPE